MMIQASSVKIEIKKLEYLYSNLATAILGSLIISIVVYFAINHQVDENILNIWIIASILLAIVRFFTYIKFRNDKITPKKISKYLTLFASLLLLSSLLWLVVPFFLLPKEIEYQVLIFFMLGGLSAGAMISLAVEYKFYVVYLLLTMLPISFVIYLEETRVTSFISITGVVYLIFLLFLAKNISKSIIQNMKLVYKNEGLVNSLKKKVDEANYANEAKSKFLSVMSHEIRTPLNAIIGFVKILKDTETNSIKKKYLNTIDSSSYLLLSVLNDVLDISKIELGSFNIDVLPYEPYPELYQLYDLYEKTASDSGIKMINSISMDMPLYLKGDILRLKQIVSNLLSNAIKFTPSDKTIELIVRYEADKSMLYVEVKDEGIGIKKDKIGTITQEFIQADNSISRKYGGTGLGLSIVSKLLSLQNAHLVVKSQYGQGSSFSFYLPVSLSEQATENIQESILFDFTGKRVLVAEDNKTNQLLISLMLEDMNIEVIMVNDGQEAEDIMKRDDAFDLILMDINMPNKNGSEAMLDIKKFNGEIVIVALTANAVSGDKEKYLNEGFDDYIAKPIDSNALKFVLAKYLSH